MIKFKNYQNNKTSYTLLPIASVIIPIYNTAEYLSECLDSVIMQTEKNIEIICVNDGSTDNSLNILHKYSYLDSRIKVVNQCNRGLSFARNVGIGASHGKYLFFVDSDDFIEPNTIELITDYAEKQLSEIVVFGINPIYCKNEKFIKWIKSINPKNTISYKNIPQEFFFDNLETGPFVWRNCFLARIIKGNKILFDQDIDFAEDMLFQFTTFMYAKSVSFIPEKLYNYRCNRQNSKMAEANLNLLKKFDAHIYIIEKMNEIVCRYNFDIFLLKKFVNFSFRYINSVFYYLTEDQKNEVSIKFLNLLNVVSKSNLALINQNIDFLLKK